MNNDFRNLPPLPSLSPLAPIQPPPAPVVSEPSKVLDKKEMSTEDKVEALIRAFTELEAGLDSVKQVFLRHSHDSAGNPVIVVPAIFENEE